MTQLTFDPTPDFFPVWTPDGQVVFSSRREGARAQLFAKAADGTGTAERLTDSPDDLIATDVSPDGDHVVIQENRSQSDLFVMAMGGERSVEGLVETPFSEGRRPSHRTVDGWPTGPTNRARPRFTCGRSRTSMVESGSSQPTEALLPCGTQTEMNWSIALSTGAS